MNKIGRLFQDKTILFSCDLQHIILQRCIGQYSVQACAKMMSKVHSLLEIPIVCSQYQPKKYGYQITDIHQIQEDHNEMVIDKDQFSIINQEALNFLEQHKDRKQAIIYGVESHITVQQTVLDLLQLGYSVHMLTDGISAINDLDRIAGIKRMEKAGAFVTTSQAVIFELIQTSEHPMFNEILPILKVSRYENEQLQKI